MPPKKSKKDIIKQMPQTVKQVKQVKPVKPTNSPITTQMLKDIINKNLTAVKTQKLFEDINSNRETAGLEPMSLKQYGSIISSMKQVILKTKMLFSGNLIDFLIKNNDVIMSVLQSNYAVNSQRKIITDIITLLTYSNNKVSAKTLLSWQLQRKQIQKKNKQDKVDSVAEEKAIAEAVKNM